MTIENAQYINELNPVWPTNTDPVAEGAGHDRVTKNAIVNSFPNIDGPVTATPAELNQVAGKGLAVIVGEVRMYCGINAPDGWLLCDGAAIPGEFTELIALIGPNTPDLQGKFLRGATVGSRNPLTTEAENVGPHNHQIYNAWTGNPNFPNGNDISQMGSSAVNGLQKQAKLNTTVTNPTGENRPANTAITYIVKT